MKRNKGLLRKTLMLAWEYFWRYRWLLSLNNAMAAGIPSISNSVVRICVAYVRTTTAGRRRDDRNDRRGRNWDRYNTYGGSNQLRQTALNAGYNEGMKEGRRDQNRGRRNFRNNSAYRNASKDYSSRLGNTGMYQRYYRDGYENGYEDGYRGY